MQRNDREGHSGGIGTRFSLNREIRLTQPEELSLDRDAGALTYPGWNTWAGQNGTAHRAASRQTYRYGAHAFAQHDIRRRLVDLPDVGRILQRANGFEHECGTDRGMTSERQRRARR